MQKPLVTYETYMGLASDFKTAFPDKFYQHTTRVPCNFRNEKRWMYQYVPISRNGSYDIRKNPVYTPPIQTRQIYMYDAQGNWVQSDMNPYGIWAHTDLFGNYTNQRLCPNFKDYTGSLLKPAVETDCP